MERRDFLERVAAVAAGLLAQQAAAEAQQASKIHRVGILANLRSGDPDLWTTFIEALRDLGYVEGQNLAIEWRVSEGQYERLPSLAIELVGLKVDVIVVPANQNAIAAKRATETIPIVMIGVTDPVGNGFVTSLAKPGGNMTGVSGSVGPELAGKQMEMLKTAVPQVSRVAILWNPGNAAHTAMLREAQRAARSLMIQVQALEARGPENFGPAFTAMAKERARGLLIIGDGMFALHQKVLENFVVKSRLPAIWRRNTVRGGILMSYDTSTPELWRRAAPYVDRILKGAKPRDLPVEQPTRFELVINLKVARQLGLTIPEWMVQQADEVIR